MIPDVISLWGLKREFQDIAPIVKSVSTLPYIWGLFLSCSHHGQPPPDEPSVADSQRHLSLQHIAGWELHPSLTWRLQLYRLAPHKGSSLCVQSCQNVCVCTYYIYILYSMYSACCPYVNYILALYTKKLIIVFECLLVCVCAHACACMCVSPFVCHFFLTA